MLGTLLATKQAVAAFDGAGGSIINLSTIASVNYEEKYGLKWAYIVSANLFGPRDKFDVEFGNVGPSLIRKFFDAKKSGGKVQVWGDGSAQRDFIYVKGADDFGRTRLFQTNPSPEWRSPSARTLLSLRRAATAARRRREYELPWRSVRASRRRRSAPLRS